MCFRDLVHFRILVILLLFNCRTYNFIKLEKPPEIITKLKVVSFGFFPLKFSENVLQKTEFKRKYSIYTALDTKRDLKHLVRFAIPVQKSSLNSYNENVSNENITKFIQNYLNGTKGAGYIEIENLIEKSQDHDNKTKYKLKETNADYFLIGYLNKPTEPDSITVKGFIMGGISINLFIFSLGVFPVFAEKAVFTRIELYDRKLNLIDSKELETNFYSMYTWWVLENKECQKESPLEFVSYCNLFNKNIPNFIYESEINKVVHKLERIPGKQSKIE